MNEHIGQNIQMLAKILGIICLVIGVLAAVILWGQEAGFVAGLIPLLVGAGTYLSSWVLYGFGYLIEVVIGLNITTDEIKSKLNDKNA